MPSENLLDPSQERDKEGRHNSGLSTRARDLAHKILRERAAVTIQVCKPNIVPVALSVCTNISPRETTEVIAHVDNLTD